MPGADGVGEDSLRGEMDQEGLASWRRGIGGEEEAYFVGDVVTSCAGGGKG